MLCRSLSFSVLTLVFGAIAGCSKNNNSSTSSGSFTATVGGSAFQGSSTGGAYSSSLGVLLVVSSSVQSKDTATIELVLPYAPPVNKPFVSDSLYLTYTHKGAEYDAWSANGQLQVTVTSLDTLAHTLAGTFAATGHSGANYNDSVVITNGKFSSAYTINP
jgi:hypothetical protein